jgi:NDP-sugar pyrophosphorylase family protein
MKTMIFAAGLGTRLKPLTDAVPKALIPINGIPLLQHLILKLKQEGFTEIIVNVHHFADQIIDFLNENHHFGIRIEISDERDALLDTGGGIRKAAWFLDDGMPFLVHNVDILSNVDLQALYQHHLKTDSLATLVVSRRATFRYLMFDKNKQLQGWINEKTCETKPEMLYNLQLYDKLAFAGIQVLSPLALDLLMCRETKFPIMDFYLSEMNNHKIYGYEPAGLKLIDVGKLDSLPKAEKLIRELSFE